MLLTNKNSIIKNNIPCFRKKNLIRFMIFYSTVPHRVFFPTNTARQVACYTFVWAIRNYKPCLNTAIINKRRAP